MSFRKPVAKCTVQIDGLGTLDGFEYADGVQQFCGIPYASLSKRWTRSELKTVWSGDHHDGTKLGPSCPNPNFDGDDADDLVPVPPNPLFAAPLVDERAALVMNIVLPRNSGKKIPVFVYVHGGSLLYGGANLPIFDCVNLVSHSVAIGKPIIAATFNYRVGLGGFLAGSAIRDELCRDGREGSGNFGLTDQQVAFAWVQRYISFLGGDKDNVTAVGESAGGISISHQLAAREPPKFHRAICMSGLSTAIPSWTIDEHDRLFGATCQHFNIDPTAPDALDQLRRIPEQDLGNATAAIQGVPSGTGNPCLDGSFHRLNPNEPHPPPAWLKSYMLGDVYHEGIIFHLNILQDDYQLIKSTLQQSMQDPEAVRTVLERYDITPSTPHATLLQRFEHMAGDAIFKLPNWLTAERSVHLQQAGALFTYHFNQRSRLKNPLEGTAYHAHELLYLFLNLTNCMSAEEVQLAYRFATAWISFAHGEKPWEAEVGQWMVWGPQSKTEVRSEDQDEEVWGYGRMRAMAEMREGEIWKQWLHGIDSIVNKRMRMGVPSAPSIRLST